MKLCFVLSVSEVIRCLKTTLLQKARDLHREHQVLQQQEADREVVAELLQHHGNGKPVDAQRRQEALQHYATCREERVQDFLRALKHKRDSYFSGLWSETALAWATQQTPCLNGGGGGLFTLQKGSYGRVKSWTFTGDGHCVTDQGRRPYYPHGAVG